MAVVGCSELQNGGRSRIDVTRLDAEASQRSLDVMPGRVSDAGRDDRDAARKRLQDSDLRSVAQGRREAEGGTCLNVLDLRPRPTASHRDPRTLACELLQRIGENAFAVELEPG